MKGNDIISKMLQQELILERILCFMAGIVIFVLSITVTTDVLFRYLFDSPIAGLYELTELMFVASVYMSLAYVQKEKGHVRIDFLLSKTSTKTQRLLNIFNYILNIIIVSLITWRSGYYAWVAWDLDDYTSGFVKWPLWPARIIVTIGCGLLCLRFLIDLWEELFLPLDYKSNNHSQ